MRPLLGAFALLAALVAGGLAVKPTAAASLSSSVTVTQEETDLSPVELKSVAIPIEEMINFHRKAGWKCVAAPDDKDKGPVMRVEAKVTRKGAFARLTEPDYLIEVKLTVPGQGTRTKTIDWEPTEAQQSPRLNFLKALGSAAAGALGTLMETDSPCTVTGKLRATLTQGGGGVQSVVSFSADAQLELGEDGSFERSLPLTASIDFTIPGCTTDYKLVNPRLQLAGSFRNDDSSLVFQSAKMTWDGVTGGLNCGDAIGCAFNSQSQSACWAPDSVATTGPWNSFSGIDPAAGGLPVALADGSRQSLPRPSTLTGDVVWEGSLELRSSSGTGAPTVALAITD